MVKRLLSVVLAVVICISSCLVMGITSVSASSKYVTINSVSVGKDCVKCSFKTHKSAYSYELTYTLYAPDKSKSGGNRQAYIGSHTITYPLSVYYRSSVYNAEFNISPDILKKVAMCYDLYYVNGNATRPRGATAAKFGVSVAAYAKGTKGSPRGNFLGKDSYWCEFDAEKLVPKVSMSGKKASISMVNHLSDRWVSYYKVSIWYGGKWVFIGNTGKASGSNEYATYTVSNYWYNKADKMSGQGVLPGTKGKRCIKIEAMDYRGNQIYPRIKSYF